jgi:hypothetical protein
MSKIEMQHSNAILAINSLDRYISTATDIETFLNMTWTIATPTTLTLIGGGQNAIVGASLYYAGNGFPITGVKILQVNGALVTINLPVTGNSGGTRVVLQTTTSNKTSQPTSNSLIGQYRNLPPYCNDFTVSSPGALIYGYIDRIIVSQIQLQFNIPTICFGRNDTLGFTWNNGADYTLITIPFGFYSPDELATAVQAIIAATPSLAPLQLTVAFNERNGYTFTSGNATGFAFPSVDYLVFSNISQKLINTILKTYRTFGINAENSELFNPAGLPAQTSFEYPNFLYTPYIDIYSDVLTNYQKIKDTNTSIIKPKGLIARILLAGVGNPQYTTGSSALGSTPFIMTADLNTPKVIQWSTDVAVPSIDFQLKDCYGELIPGDIERYPTEFQMTLLCIEG